MTTQASPVTIPLGSACKEGGIQELCEKLKEEYENPIILDAADLGGTFPSLLVQTLLCAERDWQLRDIEFSVSNLSQDCNDTFCLLGLDENHFSSKDAS